MLLGLLGFTMLSQAQKNIIICDSLTLNAERQEVKGRGKAFTDGSNFEFGDFKIISPKNVVYNEKQKEKIDSFFNKLPQTRTEFETLKKFSFKLCNKTNDTVIIAGTSSLLNNNTLEKTSQLSASTSIKISEVLKTAYRLSVFINSNVNFKDTWVLNMEITDQGNMVDSLRKPLFAPIEYRLSLKNGFKRIKNTETNSDSILPVGLKAYDAFLTNGERNILLLRRVSSDKNKLTRLPAMGFEFIENNIPLCAVQYFGGGILGTFNKNYVWIDKNIEPEMKIILAAAMSAIMFDNESILKSRDQP